MQQVDPSFKTPRYYSSSTGGNSDHKKSKRPKKGKWSLALIVIVLVGLAGLTYFHKDSGTKIVHAVSEIVKPKTAAPLPPTDLSAASLAAMSQSINSVINQNSDIDMSVNLINLQTNQALHYGENETFEAASTGKILTAAYFLHEVEQGQQSLGENVNGNTAQNELQQMIVVSDDDSWEDLNELLGYNNLQNYVDTTLGISDYQAYNNYLSSADIADALEQLWHGKLLNNSDTQLLLSYLQQANYRQYIVPAVPAEDTIYHKVGLYEDYVNDAAIITHGNNAFVIVIFTNGNGVYNWPARAAMMQQITKAALVAYFNQT